MEGYLEYLVAPIARLLWDYPNTNKKLDTVEKALTHTAVSLGVAKFYNIATGTSIKSRSPTDLLTLGVIEVATIMVMGEITSAGDPKVKKSVLAPVIKSVLQSYVMGDDLRSTLLTEGSISLIMYFV